jgi:hypothetical protein
VRAATYASGLDAGTDFFISPRPVGDMGVKRHWSYTRVRRR